MEAANPAAADSWPRVVPFPRAGLDSAAGGRASWYDGGRLPFATKEGTP